MSTETVDDFRMRTTPAGVALIKQFEGLRLVAYQDQGGIWTIGWGNTQGVVPGMVISHEEADRRLARNILEAETGLNGCVAADTLNDNQYSALVSFCFNVGLGRKDKPKMPGKDGFRELRSGKPSTLRSCVLAGDFEGAAHEFPKWVRGAGKPSVGLLRRRMAELHLFLEHVPASSPNQSV